MDLNTAPDSYNAFGNFLLGDDTPRAPYAQCNEAKSPSVIYAKEYDKVLEIIDKLEEVLSTYGLEVGCVAGTYSPIDIQVHITEFGKSNL